ncbi:EamA family transporter, partial [Bacillus sp. HC-Mk]
FQSWSPLRYTTLTCLFGSISLIVIVTFLTYTNIVTMPSLRTVVSVRFELFYMSIIAGVIAVFCWNMGNRYISSINGILFMNLVPILALIGSIFRGYTVDKIEIAGAALTIIALLCNNLWQRKVNIKIPTSVR